MAPDLPPSSGPRTGRTVLRAWLGLWVALAGLGLAGSPLRAESESYLLGPGSNVGPATRIKTTNCRPGPDGSITCDTVIENSPSDTPAKPSVTPFDN